MFCYTTLDPDVATRTWCLILLHHVLFRHSNTHHTEKIYSVLTYRIISTSVSVSSFWRHDTSKTSPCDKSMKQPFKQEREISELCVFKDNSFFFFFSPMLTSPLFGQLLFFKFRSADFSYSHWLRIKWLSNKNEVFHNLFPEVRIAFFQPFFLWA